MKNRPLIDRAPLEHHDNLNSAQQLRNIEVIQMQNRKKEVLNALSKVKGMTKKYYKEHPEDKNINIDENGHLTVEDNTTLGDSQHRLLKNREIIEKLNNGIPMDDDDKDFLNKLKYIHNRKLAPRITNGIPTKNGAIFYEQYMERMKQRNDVQRKQIKHLLINISTAITVAGFIYFTSYITIPETMIGSLFSSGNMTTLGKKILDNRRMITFKMISVMKTAHKGPKEFFKALGREAVSMTFILVSNNIHLYDYLNVDVKNTQGFIGVLTGTFNTGGFGSTLVSSLGQGIIGTLTNCVLAEEPDFVDLDVEMAERHLEEENKILETKRLLESGKLSMETDRLIVEKGTLRQYMENSFRENKKKIVMLSLASGIALGWMNIALPSIEAAAKDIEMTSPNPKYLLFDGPQKEKGINIYKYIATPCRLATDFGKSLVIDMYIIPKVMEMVMPKLNTGVNISVQWALSKLNIDPNRPFVGKKMAEYFQRRFGIDWFYQLTLYGVLTKIIGLGVKIKGQSVILEMPDNLQKLYDVATLENISKLQSIAYESVFSTDGVFGSMLNFSTEKLKNTSTENLPTENIPSERDANTIEMLKKMDVYIQNVHDKLHMLGIDEKENELFLGNKFSDEIANLNKSFNEVIKKRKDIFEYVSNPSLVDDAIRGQIDTLAKSAQIISGNVNKLQKNINNIVSQYANRLQTNSIRDEMEKVFSETNKKMGELKSLLSKGEYENQKLKLVGKSGKSLNFEKLKIETLEQRLEMLKNGISLDSKGLEMLYSRKDELQRDMDLQSQTLNKFIKTYKRDLLNFEQGVKNGYKEITGKTFTESGLSIEQGKKYIKAFNMLDNSSSHLKEQVQKLQDKIDKNKTREKQSRSMIGLLRGMKASATDPSKQKQIQKLLDKTKKSRDASKKISKRIDNEMSKITSRLEETDKLIKNLKNVENYDSALKQMNTMTDKLNDSLWSVPEIEKLLFDQMENLNSIVDNYLTAVTGEVPTGSQTEKNNAAQKDARIRMLRAANKFSEDQLNSIAEKEKTKTAQITKLAEAMAKFKKSKNSEDAPSLEDLDALNDVKQFLLEKTPEKYKDNVEKAFAGDVKYLSGLDKTLRAGAAFGTAKFTSLGLLGKTIWGAVASGTQFVAQNELLSRLDNKLLTDMSDVFNDLSDINLLDNLVIGKFEFLSVLTNVAINAADSDSMNMIHKYLNNEIWLPTLYGHFGRGILSDVFLGTEKGKAGKVLDEFGKAQLKHAEKSAEKGERFMPF